MPGIEPTTFASVVNVADAVEWIAAQEKSSPDKPWFAWVALNLAHATSQNQPSSMAVPNADLLDAASYNEMKACGGVFGSANPGSCGGRALMRAMTNALDTLVGKLLTQVDGLDPNTFVIFIGDNGTPMYGRPNLDFIDNMYITQTGRGKGTPMKAVPACPWSSEGPALKPPQRAANMFTQQIYSQRR